MLKSRVIMKLGTKGFKLITILDWITKNQLDKEGCLLLDLFVPFIHTYLREKST